MSEIKEGVVKSHGRDLNLVDCTVYSVQCTVYSQKNSVV
jgi:hypothetical protein